MKQEARRLAQQSMAFVLAGGRGSRLYELTDRRAKPAMYFGGKSRIIDFPLSNAVNSGIRRIGVATQYKAHSLIRHLQRGWSFFRAERNESLDILPASQRMDDENWYKGTADAVTQNTDIIRGYRPKYIVILAGDHIYKQDYATMIAHHAESGADVTVGCIEVPRVEATGFGVMKVDTNDRILECVEKPGDPPAMPRHPDMALASMGIYVFETELLLNMLKEFKDEPDYGHDFGGDGARDGLHIPERARADPDDLLFGVRDLRSDFGVGALHRGVQVGLYLGFRLGYDAGGLSACVGQGAVVGRFGVLGLPPEILGRRDVACYHPAALGKNRCDPR